MPKNSNNIIAKLLPNKAQTNGQTHLDNEGCPGTSIYLKPTGNHRSSPWEGKG
jgi:hypothetical protein